MTSVGSTMVVAAGRTDSGVQREVNEDRFHVDRAHVALHEDNVVVRHGSRQIHAQCQPRIPVFEHLRRNVGDEQEIGLAVHDCDVHRVADGGEVGQLPRLAQDAHVGGAGVHADPGHPRHLHLHGHLERFPLAPHRADQ